VIFRKPIFYLGIKLGCLGKNLLRLGLRRYVGEGVVNGISLSPTGLKIIGGLVSRLYSVTPLKIEATPL
jgi:hypothetical protein